MNRKLTHLVTLLACIFTLVASSVKAEIKDKLMLSPITLIGGDDFCIRSSSNTINNSEWMKNLPDTILMCKLSLPGTHDSGSRFGGPSLQTQQETLKQQLYRGIRAFDIRLNKRGQALGVYHSNAFQHLYWEDDVLPLFINYLKTHPSETLVVSLKREGGSAKDYTSFLSHSLNQPQYQSYFVDLFNSDLRMKDCRGKIIFIHRDSAMPNFKGAECRGWQDNATCLLTLYNRHQVETKAILQDEYQYRTASPQEANKKIDAILHALQRIVSLPLKSHYWGISFVSATALPQGTPDYFAKIINQKIAAHLKLNQLAPSGILFIDFVDKDGGSELVNYLINSNFRICK